MLSKGLNIDWRGIKWADTMIIESVKGTGVCGTSDSLYFLLPKPTYVLFLGSMFWDIWLSSIDTRDTLQILASVPVISGKLQSFGVYFGSPAAGFDSPILGY